MKPPELMTVEAARNWVESEREECAKIADRIKEGASEEYQLACSDLAGLIRSRVTP